MNDELQIAKAATSRDSRHSDVSMVRRRTPPSNRLIEAPIVVGFPYDMRVLANSQESYDAWAENNRGIIADDQSDTEDEDIPVGSNRRH